MVTLQSLAEIENALKEQDLRTIAEQSSCAYIKFVGPAHEKERVITSIAGRLPMTVGWKFIALRTYVLGFVFNTDFTYVALIRKARPDWQAGMLNGIGGEVESAESFAQAMSREFVEETGLLIHENEWTHYGDMYSFSHVVLFRAVVDNKRFGQIRTTTDEEVVLSDVQLVVHPCNKTLSNVPMLILGALDPNVNNLVLNWR